MPSFKLHMYASAAVGTAGMGFGLTYLDWNSSVSILAGIAGAVGGMIPDLDSDTGRPVRIVSGLVSVILTAGVVQYLLPLGWPPTEIALVGVAVMLFFNIFGVMVFKSLTRHRGMFHSLPAVLTYAAALAAAFVPLSREIALTIGLIGLGGGLSHLLLDALFSMSLDPLKLKSKNRGATVCAWTLCLLFLALAFIDLDSIGLGNYGALRWPWFNFER